MNYCLLNNIGVVLQPRYKCLATNIASSIRFKVHGITIVTWLYVQFKQQRNELVVTRERKYSFVAARMIVTRRYRRVYVQYKKPGVSLSTEKICRVAGSHFYGA